MKIKSMSIIMEHGFDPIYLKFLDSNCETHFIDLKKEKVNYDEYYLITVNEPYDVTSYHEYYTNDDFKDIIATAIKINRRYQDAS